MAEIIIEKCGEEKIKSKNCLIKFNIMDDSISFIKSDECGRCKYRWCINCKKYNDELNELMIEYQRKENQIIEEEKDKEDKERQINIRKTDWNKLSKNLDYCKNLLDKDNENYHRLIEIEDEEFRKKEKIKEEKARKIYDNMKYRNKERDINMKNSLEEYINIPIKDEFKKILDNIDIFEIKAIKCHKCDKYKCFPFNFEKIYYYFNFKIPDIYYHNCRILINNIWNTKYIPNICDVCFTEILEINKKNYDKYVENNTYICSCGKSWCSIYKKNSYDWKNEIKTHEETNYIHQLYIKHIDTFCDLKDFLGFNLFIKKRNELIEFIKNRNIDFIIVDVMNTKQILEGLIEIFKKNNKNFPIINNDYEIFNFLTYDELVLMIIEFKLKIPYYKKLTKEQLINKIINYQ